MKLKQAVIVMASLITFCCACSSSLNLPTKPTVTMTAGKDFGCWNAHISTTKDLKSQNLLISSDVAENMHWKTTFFHFDLSNETTELEVALPGELWPPAVSPNGQYIVYVDDVYDYYIYDRLKTAYQKISYFADLKYAWMKWSKDSQCLFVETQADGKIFAYQIADNAVQEKDRGSVPEGVLASVGKSPDGKFTVLGCPNSKNICLSNAEGQRINHPALELDTIVEKYAMVEMYGWSADSRALLFGFSTGKELMGGYINTIRLVLVDENGVQDYKDFSQSDAVWAPDGKRFLMLRGGNRFELYEISTGNSKEFIPPEGYSGRMIWFPDSKQIIFISHDNEYHYSLYRLNLDEGEFVKLPVTVKDTIQNIFLIP